MEHLCRAEKDKDTVDADAISTTVGDGISTYKDSAKDDGSDGSVDSMSTGRSSKMSLSRPERERGPKRRAKKLARAEQHKAERGLEWKDPEQQRQAAAEMATGVKGTLARGIHDNKLREKKEEPLPDVEEKQEIIEYQLCKEIPVDMKKWV